MLARSNKLNIERGKDMRNDELNLKELEKEKQRLLEQGKTFEAENGEKTIYMKVEFNHAGNGKTIPLIMWPKDASGKFCSLTTENFIDTLYIPVKLAYINGRYVYSIVGAENENDEIALILFEPKLDMIQDIEIDGV